MALMGGRHVSLIHGFHLLASPAQPPLPPSVARALTMSLRKPKNKNSKRVIDHDEHDPSGISARTVSVMANNYYEAGPSGVHLTDRTVDMEIYDSPPSRLAKLPQLHSPPRDVVTPISSLHNTLTSDAGSWRSVTDVPPPGNTSHPAQLSAGMAHVPFASVWYGTTASVSASPASMVPPPIDSQLDNEASQNRKKKKASISTWRAVMSYIETWVRRSANKKLDEARVHIPLILQHLLEREAHPKIPGPCQRCNRRAAHYRCRDCSESPALCGSCMYDAHSNTPFHWVEEWHQPRPNKWCFAKRDLSELGFVYSLGHQGRKCPQVSSRKPSIHNLVVTHVNGIHNARLQYCECSFPRRAPHEEQLVLAGLIPTSFQKLQSAFTVEVLEDSAHEDILVSQKSPYDYMRKLWRRTNNAAAHTVTVRQPLFTSASACTKRLTGSISRIPLRVLIMEIHALADDEAG